MKMTVIGALVCCLSAVSYFSGKASHKGLEIIHFDVDYGDSAFIRTEEGVKVLLDAGGTYASGKTAAERAILPYLMSEGVGKLDLLIASHDHNDHTGGIIDILKNIKVDRLAVSAFIKNMDKIIRLCEDEKIEVSRLQRGDRIQLGTDKEIEVLYPNDEAAEYSSNNLSLVLKLKYKEAEFLFMGDAESEAEALIVGEYGGSVSSDVIKIAHHGSKTSSTEDLLKKVKPAFAIISVGRNSWGHPDALTLSKLAAAGAQVFRTDTDGAVNIKTDGRTIEIKKTVN